MCSPGICIDVDKHEIPSPVLDQPIPLELTSQGLFSIDINQLALHAKIEGRTTVMYHMWMKRYTMEIHQRTSKRLSAIHRWMTQIRGPKTHQVFVIARCSILWTVSMATLGARLRQLQVSCQQETTALPDMSLEELGQTIVKFGNTHNGKTLNHLWTNNQDWIQWMVDRYSQSPKQDHRLLMMFIEKKITEAEGNQVSIPLSRGTTAPMKGIKMGTMGYDDIPRASQSPSRQPRSRTINIRTWWSHQWIPKTRRRNGPNWKWWNHRWQARLGQMFKLFKPECWIWRTCWRRWYFTWAKDRASSSCSVKFVSSSLVICGLLHPVIPGVHGPN